MSTVCTSCGAPSSCALCWACDDGEFNQMIIDDQAMKAKKREEDIALLRSIVDDDECVDKLLNDYNYISDKLFDVDEELLSRITGKALCPKKKLEALKKQLMNYINDSKRGDANALVIECIRRGHIRNHKRQYQDLMGFIHSNFNTSDLPSVVKSTTLKQLFSDNLSKAKDIVITCAKEVCSIMKYPKYGKYVTKGRVDKNGVTRSKEDVEANECSLRMGLTLELLISGKDINLKQGKNSNNTDDTKRRQGREYMAACILVDVYKCMHDKYSIPAPLFGSLLKLVVANCGINLFIKTNDYINRCDTQADTFHYAHPKKVMGYIYNMEKDIRKLNGNVNEPYFRRVEAPIRRR